MLLLVFVSLILLHISLSLRSISSYNAGILVLPVVEAAFDQNYRNGGGGGGGGGDGESQSKSNNKLVLKTFRVHEDEDDDDYKSHVNHKRGSATASASASASDGRCGSPSSSPSMPCSKTINKDTSDAKDNNGANEDGDDTDMFTNLGWEPPCFDLNPNCHRWSLHGECFNIKSKVYMADNCPLSCNLCNPLLHDFDHPMTYTAGGGKTSSGHFGVEQQIDFEDSPITNPAKWGIAPHSNAAGSAAGPGLGAASKDNHEHIRSAKYLRRRLQEILYSMEEYIQQFLFLNVEINQPGSSFLLLNNEGKRNNKSNSNNSEDYNDNDNDNDDDATHQFNLGETCINRHPYCALWAARGYCEVRPRAMAETCSPVCHTCDFTLTYKSDTVQFPHDLKSYTSTPFKRLDLIGIIEAIEEDRVVIDLDADSPNMQDAYHYRPFRDKDAPSPGVDDYFGKGGASPDASSSTSSKSNDQSSELTEKVFMLPLGQIQTLVYKLKPGTERALQSAAVRKREPKRDAKGNIIPFRVDAGDGDEDLGPVTVVLEKFLSKEECDSLLDTISYGIGVDMSDGIPEEKDGFPSPTVEFDNFQPNAHTFIETRYSSRAVVYPTFDENSRFSPAIERLLSKVSMISGIPADAHVEIPIIFDKFTPNNYQHIKSHFDEAIHAEKLRFANMGMPLSRLSSAGSQYCDSDGTYRSNVVSGSSCKNDKGTQHGRKQKNEQNKRIPQTMLNPRVLCVTVFLNDTVEGGELVFPHMANFTVQPLKGRAVLYPTVLSLVGENLDTEQPLDGEYAALYDDEESYLVEDLGTIMHHNIVTSGTKYSLTICLRRYENDDYEFVEANDEDWSD